MLGTNLLRKVEQKGIIVPFNPTNIGQGTIKLTLHKNIQLYVSDKPIKPGRQFPEEDYRTVDISYEEFYLQPGQAALVKSAEMIRLPKNMTARVYDRMHSELFGLSINPIQYIASRFAGRITSLIVNHGTVPVRLVPGIQICQMSIQELFGRRVKKRQKQIKSVFIIINSILTALIGYAVNLENWPFVLGSSVILAIMNITYMFWKN